MTDDISTSDLMQRVVAIEIKLELLNQKIDAFLEENKVIVKTLHGNGDSAGLKARVGALEKTERAFKWALGVIYGALVTLLVKLTSEKF